MKRRKTGVVKVGDVKIGGRNPVVIQSMVKRDTRKIREVVSEIKKLKAAGCKVVRLAVRDRASAKAIKTIKRKTDIPLVGDIHFDYRLATECIKNGIDKIRINPGNMRNPDELRKVIKACKKRKIPIRIGLNSGSLPRESKIAKSRITSEGIVAYARKCIKFFENENFRDIIISLKSSDVRTTVESYRRLAALCDYPFHLGITAAGPHDTGIVKSSIAIGALLLDGIGDTVRVSLTGDSALEVIASKRILQALGLGDFGPDIISCPTCGRCRVDLIKIVREIEKRIGGAVGRHPRSEKYVRSAYPRKVAIMGCEVNGPGEAEDADVGIAFGRDSGILFKKGKMVKKVKVKNAVKELLKTWLPKTIGDREL